MELFAISKHAKYKKLNIDKHFEQSKCMQNYLIKPYKNEIYWFGMNESCYNEYLDKQNQLYEGLITSYPISTVIKQLNKLGVWAYVNTSANSIQSIVVKDVKDSNINDILKITNACGYVKRNKSGNEYSFVPKYPHEATETAYSDDMCLYHLTNDICIDKILKFGLIPKTKNKIEYHPERIYVTKKRKMSLRFISQMFNKMAHNNIIKTLYILKIDLSKCEDKRFFWDPSAQNGMFTYENIPPQCISIEEEIDVNDL